MLVPFSVDDNDREMSGESEMKRERIMGEMERKIREEERDREQETDRVREEETKGYMVQKEVVKEGDNRGKNKEQ